MKKIIPLFLGITCFSSVLYAQKVYLKLNPSYNLAAKSQLSYDYSLRYFQGSDNIIETTSNVRSSLGKGYLGNFAIGFNHNENLSTELNFSYLNGKPTTATEVIHYYNGDEKLISNISANVISFTPSLVFSFGSEAWKPYISTGISLNFVNMREEIVYDFFATNGSTIMDIEYKGGPTIGFTTKIGFLTTLNDLFSIFGEVGFSYLNYSPNSGEITKYTINKQDSLSTLTEFERKTEYEDEVAIWYELENDVWVEKENHSAPKQRRKFEMPISYFSISIGIKMNIRKKTAPTTPTIE